MEQSAKKPKISRKKQATEHIDEKTNSIIHSPNLKNQFLTDNMGPLIKQLRKEEFNQIMNLLNSNSKIMDGEIAGKSVNKILMCVGVGNLEAGANCLIKQAIAQFEKQCKSVKGKQVNLYKVSSIKFIHCNSYGTSLKQIKNYISAVQNSKSSGSIEQKIINIKNSTENSVLNVILINQLSCIVKYTNQDCLCQFMSLFSNGRSKEQYQDKYKKPKQIYILIGKSYDVIIKQKIEKKLGSVYNINTILFKPYLIEQKVKIVNYCLNKVKQTRGIQLNIPQDIIKFIIKSLNEKKLEDIHNLIEVVEQILSISQENQQVIADINRGQIAVIDISLGFLQHETIKSMLVRSKVRLIQSLRFQQQLVLAIIYQQLKVNFQLSMQYQKLQDEFLKALKQMKYSRNSLTETVGHLECYGVVQMRNESLTKIVTKNGKLLCKACVVPKVGLNDIQRALSKVPLFSKYFC